MNMAGSEGGRKSDIESGSQEPLPKEFEQMLQKLEAEVRGHIRVEQQLKLQMEAQQFRLEESLRQQYDAQLRELQDVLVPHPRTSIGGGFAEAGYRKAPTGPRGCGRGP